MVRPRSGLARRHQLSGDVAMQVGLDRQHIVNIYLHKTAPCMNNSTCPEGKLEPSYWDRPDQYEYFKALNILLASNTPSPNNGKPSGAVIAGAVAGSLGFVATVLVAAALLWRKKKHTQKQKGNNSASTMEENNPVGGLASPMAAGTGAHCSFSKYDWRHH